MSEQSVVRPPAFAPGVFQENRDERSHAEVVLGFEASAGNLWFEGISLSLAGFKVRGHEKTGPDGEIIHRHLELGVGDKRDVRLRISLAGFICEIKAIAVCTERVASDGQDILIFTFIAIDSASQEAIRRIVRSYLSGFIPSPNDVAIGADSPTMRTSEAKPEPAAKKPHGLRNAFGLGVSLCILAGAVGFAGISLYERVFTVRSSFATITAPKIDILSPAVGQVRTELAGIDQKVGRDQLLFNISSDELDADIEYAEARLAYFEAASASPENTAATNPLGGVSLDTSLITGSLPPAGGAPAGGQEMPDRLVNAAVAVPGQGSDYGKEADLAEGLLKALRLRQSSLLEHSPCECQIAWSQEDGAWVKEGDLVMTLARTGAEDLRVEALVNLKFANQLHMGQHAVVELMESGKTIPAVIEKITLDPGRQPRVGFPEWLRREPTLASVVLATEQDLDPALIGTPVKVTLGDPINLTQQVALLWQEFSKSAVAAE